MKKLLKNLVLGILIICTVITAVPVTNTSAKEIKGYKKHKTVTKVIDINKKNAAEEYVNLVHKYGEKGIKEKVYYDIRFKCNEKKWDKLEDKLLKDFQYKVMRAKNNKYGLSMGLLYSDNIKYKNNFYYFQSYAPANDVVYFEQIIEKALNSKVYRIDGYDYEGQYDTAKAFVKDIFPNADSFKNASESVKLQFIASYMGKNCMHHGWSWPSGKRYKDYFWFFSFQGAASGYICKGVCADFADMYVIITRMLCNTGYEDSIKKNYCGAEYADFGPPYNHAVAACYARNSSGKIDIFEGNNDTFRLFSYPASLQFKSAINNANISLFYMYFHSKRGDNPPCLIWMVKGKTDKDVKKYYNGKNNSELFNICYNIMKNYDERTYWNLVENY